MKVIDYINIISPESNISKVDYTKFVNEMKSYMKINNIKVVIPQSHITSHVPIRLTDEQVNELNNYFSTH